jgi:hypothetical protein
MLYEFHIFHNLQLAKFMQKLVFKLLRFLLTNTNFIQDEWIH